MNANPQFLAATATVDEAAIQPLPNSRKIYVHGSRPDIQVPMREISREVRYREQAIDGQVIACTPEYFGMNRLKIARGRALSELDMQTWANVVVLAHEAAQRLFPIEDPLGRSVQIGQEFYVVVGIAAERSAAAAIGGSLDARQYDRDVYIPLSTFRARIGDRVFTIRAGSTPGARIPGRKFRSMARGGMFNSRRSDVRDQNLRR